MNFKTPQEYDQYREKNIRGWFKELYPEVKIKELKFSVFKEESQDKLHFITDEPIDAIQQSDWEDENKENSEPSLTRVQITLSSDFKRFPRERLDYNQLRSLANKIVWGDWPDNEDYAPNERKQYKDLSLYECWHYRSINTVAFSDGIKIDLLIGMCYCT